VPRGPEPGSASIKASRAALVVARTTPAGYGLAQTVDPGPIRVRPVKEPATQVLKNIRRATRRHFSAEDKIRIVLEGLRGEDSIAVLCRREGIVQNLYYRWSKDFLEAGKKRLAAPKSEARDVTRHRHTIRSRHFWECRLDDAHDGD
jgi:transposase-like protein